MMTRSEIQQPPLPDNHDGQPRKVGVELEFAGLDARTAAEIISRRFHGRVEEIDSHRFKVCDSRVGDFVAELDTRFVHDEFGLSDNGDDPLSVKLGRLRRRAQQILGDVSAVIVPYEIVCPPVPIAELVELDALVMDLHRAGAKGTDENPLYAFALQLNPDIASAETRYLLSILQAFVLLSDWLRTGSERDILRHLIGFAEPFPRAYAIKILKADYAPDQGAFIEDYLAHNRTRNRELDLTPLFGWLDEARLRRYLKDVRIKSRPTFHYRLPDARIGSADWSIAGEWNRWTVVERLANDRSSLERAALAYRNHFSGPDMLPADQIDGAWVRRISDIAGL